MICLHFEKMLKGHQYGYLMKGIGIGSKNMLLVFRFSYFFTFWKHKQQFVYILRSRPREWSRPME